MSAKRNKILSLFLILSLFVGMVGIFNVDTTYAAAKKKIHIKKKTVILSVGETYTQKLIAKNGKTIKAKKVKWKSSNKSVAKITKKGKITAVSAGTVKMTAKYKGKKYKFTVQVMANPGPVVPSAPSKNISLETKSLVLHKGETKVIKVTIDKYGSLTGFSDNNNIECTWGDWTGWVDGKNSIYLNVTGVVAGKSKVKVHFTDDPANYDTLDITVNQRKTSHANPEQAYSQLQNYILATGKKIQPSDYMVGDYYIESAATATKDHPRITIAAEEDKPTLIVEIQFADDEFEYWMVMNASDLAKNVNQFNMSQPGLFSTNYWGDIYIDKYSGQLSDNNGGLVRIKKTGPIVVTDSNELMRVYTFVRKSILAVDDYLYDETGYDLVDLGYLYI